ncbi:MAG TPA: LysM peptidoglycan-binding domain-containing protein [Alphaproteobacteria bacterium]|nr:LysM peptidoglycan-binding domain-containing protein [Alphaproteobacteria bacterium]
MKRVVIVGAVGIVAIVAALILSRSLDHEGDPADPLQSAELAPPAPAADPSSEQPNVADSAPAEPAAEVATAAPAAAGVASTPSQPQASPAATAPASPTQEGPSFDVVRINPRGNAVIAGRAKPNSMVTVYDNGKEVGTVIADSRGEWVLLPEAPFEPGNRELTLSEKDESGIVADSGQSVVLVVPNPEDGEPGQAPPAAVAVLVPNVGGGGTVLQPPSSEGEDGLSEDGLSLDIIDYDENGQIVVGGRAPVGANVQVYIDNLLVGGAIANADGRWQVRPENAVAPGLHTLRVDQVEPPDAQVIARIETPFSQAAFAEASPGSIVVQPGNSLWRIARRTYGHGIRYTLIFEANKEQIRNPDLIYPGQVFSLPKQQP